MATSQSIGLQPSFPVNNGLAPSKLIGPQAISQSFDFTSTQQYLFDLTTAAVQAGVTTVQSVYVDNSANPFKVTFYFAATNQNVVIPPFSQGTFPIIGKVVGQGVATSGNQSLFPGKGGLTAVYFLNVPLPFNVWSTREKSTLCGIGESNLSNSVWIELLAINVLRRRFIIGNNSVNTGCYIMFEDASLLGSAGVGGIYLPGGGGTYDSGSSNEDCYIGPVAGIWQPSGAGQVTTLEFTDATQPVSYNILPPH